MLFIYPSQEEIKAEASILQNQSTEKIKRSTALNIVAQEYGAPNWNTLSRKLKSNAVPEEELNRYTKYLPMLFSELRDNQQYYVHKDEQHRDHEDVLINPIQLLRDKTKKELGVIGRLFLVPEKELVAARYAIAHDALDSSKFYMTGEEYPLSELPSLQDKEAMQVWWSYIFAKQIEAVVQERKERRAIANKLKVGDHFFGSESGRFWRIIGFKEEKVELVEVEAVIVDELDVPAEQSKARDIRTGRKYHMLDGDNRVLINSTKLVSPKVIMEDGMEEVYFPDDEEEYDLPDLLDQVQAPLPFYWHSSYSYNLSQSIEMPKHTLDVYEAKNLLKNLLKSLKGKTLPIFTKKENTGDIQSRILRLDDAEYTINEEPALLNDEHYAVIAAIVSNGEYNKTTLENIEIEYPLRDTDKERVKEALSEMMHISIEITGPDSNHASFSVLKNCVIYKEDNGDEKASITLNPYFAEIIKNAPGSISPVSQ